MSSPILAAAALATGFLTVSAPTAQAAPGDCLDWAFNGGTTINVTGNFVPPDNDGFNIAFNSTGKNASGPAQASSMPIVNTADGTISGGINGTGISLTWTQSGGNGIVLPLNGNIGPDGIARGKTGGQFEGGDWTTGQLHCTKKEEAQPAEPQGPPPGPDVSGEPVLGGLVVHIKDNSGKTSKCHYDSEVVDRDFTLNANSTFDLRIIPAVPLLRAWPVTVSCDNGATTSTTIDF